MTQYNELLTDPAILAAQRFLRRLDIRFRGNVSDNPTLTITKLPVTMKVQDSYAPIYLIKYKLEIETLLGGNRWEIIQHVADREDYELTPGQLKNPALYFLDDIAISNIRESTYERVENEK